MTVSPVRSTIDLGFQTFSASPAERLAPYVARHVVTRINIPAEAVMEDFLLHETAYIRVPADGRWSTPVDGRWTSFDCPVLFGQNSRMLRLRCEGPSSGASIAIPPAAWGVFFDTPAIDLADGLVPIDGAFARRLRWACADVRDVAATIARLDQVIGERIDERRIEPCAISARFERYARDDPARPIAEIAREMGVGIRHLADAVRRSFGLTPKVVMRRSRFLDMVAAIRGVDDDDEGMPELRFYDASHLNRECRCFVAMTPNELKRTPTPLFTSGLEVRTHRRLADRAAGALR